MARHADARQADKSGTFYRRDRQYDPSTGRFTQEDPIGLAGGLNVYGFAAGDPVTYSDPYGLSAEDNCCQDNPNPRNLELEVRTFQWNARHPRESTMLGGLGLLAVGGGVTLASGLTTLTVGIHNAGILARGGIMASAGGKAMPVIKSAADKLNDRVVSKFGGTAGEWAGRVLTQGQRYVDKASGNINYLLTRPDGGGYIRVTTDPTASRVISAGLNQSRDVANQIASGRLRPISQPRETLWISETSCCR